MKRIVSFLVLAMIGLTPVYAYSQNDVKYETWDTTLSDWVINRYPAGEVNSLFGYYSGGAYGLFTLDSTWFSMNGSNISLKQTVFDALYAPYYLVATVGANNDKVDAHIAQTSAATSSLQSQINSLSSTVSGLSAVPPTITNSVSHAIVTSTSATGTMLSSTKTTNVMYSVNIVTTATIGGASAGEVLLEISPTNTSTSTWTVVNRVKNSQTVTLALALNSIQDLTLSLMGNVPAGYYVRLRSSNISGTPTYTLVTGQEMQF